MAEFYLLVLAVSGCLSSYALTTSRNKAKVVEEYVVSAKFDEINFPQLNHRSQSREVYQEKETKNWGEKGGSPPFPPSPRDNHRDGAHLLDDLEDRGSMEERDYLVHHHHLPPVPHPPPHPPPVPPVGLAYAPSLFAVGLITFLILLNSLQTSLLILKSKGSVLGSVAGALGRRKRFALENAGVFLEKHDKTKFRLPQAPS